MSHKLKLLVEFNNEKQTLFVESDYNLITFKVVLNEIISQITQNISLKTHSFEIYDMDFKEFVWILNENQMIENLSRIRITSKDTIDLNNRLNISGFDDKFEEMSLTDSGLSNQRSYLLKSLKKMDQSLSDNLWFSDYFFESKDNIWAKNTKNSLKAKEETKTKDFSNSRTSRRNQRMERLSKNNSMNYLDLPHISFSPQQTYYTSMRRHKNSSLIVLRYNIDILKAIKLILNLMTKSKALRNVSFEEQWKIISEQMVINGFREWTPQMCRKKFFHIFKLYKKCLEKCPDLDIASIINPLFNDFHMFDNKQIFSSNEFKELIDLRKRFQTKNQIKTFDYRAVNDFGKLKKMCSISEEQIHMFKTLTECMDIIYKEVDSDSNITKNSIQFWDKVAKQMIFKDYIDFSGTECYNIFREYVSDYYAQVLVTSPDIRTAAKMYPLFEFIGSLNLKQYLSYSSYERIELLRHNLTKTK